MNDFWEGGDIKSVLPITYYIFFQSTHLLLKAGPKLHFLHGFISILVIGDGHSGNPCLFARPQSVFHIPRANVVGVVPIF